MPLNVSGPFVAHHQEVASVCVASDICFSSKSTVGRPGQVRTGLPTVDLEVKQAVYATLYSRPPGDGLQMGPKYVEAW
jgi:hypothetical protein